MCTDRTITCFDCGNEFEFSAGEQEFYAQRGFTEPPKRCASCRAIRKAARGTPARLTAADGGGGRFGDYRTGDGGAHQFGYADGHERRPREMFEAICANCGTTASVPFRPSGIKPVYCRDCFQGR